MQRADPRRPPLSPASAELPRQKSCNWAAALDEQLAAVEAGEQPVEVRSRTDETVRKLISALRGEAILNV